MNSRLGLTQVPLALLSSLIGSNSLEKDAQVLLAATNLGSINLLLKRNANSSVEILRSIPNRLDSSPIILLDYIMLSDSLGVIIIINRNGQVSVLKNSDSSFSIRRFSLMRKISSVCRIDSTFVFSSGISIYSFSITADPEILLSSPQIISSSSLPLSIVRLFSSQSIAILDSHACLTKWSLGSPLNVTEAGNTGQRIAKTLQLLTQNLDLQDSLKSEEQQIDGLIQNVNLSIHAGSIKNHFNLRISPKIETDSLTLVLSLVVPTYLNSHKYWSIAITLHQEGLLNSYSIPLEEFKVPHNSKSKNPISTLQHRIRLQNYSLHPLTVHGYLNFHISSMVLKKKVRKGDESMLLVPSDSTDYATFPLGVFIFDALQLLARAKTDLIFKAKSAPSNFRSRLLHLLNAGNRSSLNATKPSPLTFDLNMSVWHFPSWVSTVSEDNLSSLFGIISKSVGTSLNKPSDASSSDSISLALESPVIDALVTLLLQPISDADRAFDTHSSLQSHKKSLQKISRKHLSCITSITAKEKAQEVRSSIVRRLSSSPHPTLKPHQDDLNMAKELNEALQDSWREVMRLEGRFSEVEHKLVRFLEYKQWRESNKGYSRVSKTSSYLHQYEASQSQDKHEIEVPNFAVLNQESDLLASHVLSLYHQVRKIIKDKYAF